MTPGDATCLGIGLMLGVFVTTYLLRRLEHREAPKRYHRFVSPCRCGWKAPGVSVDTPAQQTPSYIVIEVQCPECSRLLRTISRNVGREQVLPALRI